VFDIYSTGFIFWNCFVKYLTKFNSSFNNCDFYYDKFNSLNIDYKLFNGILNQSFFINTFKASDKKCGNITSKNLANKIGFKQNYFILLTNNLSSNLPFY